MMVGTGMKENPRAILQSGIDRILGMRQRQAPDDPIGLQVPNPRISVWSIVEYSHLTRSLPLHLQHKDRRCTQKR